MPLAGPLLSAAVTVVGDTALVKLANRSGSRVVFDVSGTRVAVDGNTVGGLSVPFDGGDEFTVTVPANGGIVATSFT